MIHCGTIDIGNTRAKLRYVCFDTHTKMFQKSELEVVPKAELTVEKLENWKRKNTIQFFSCSASGSYENDIKKWFSHHKVIILDHKTTMPIKIHYKTPETLGRDRIAVAIAANSLYPNEGNLVIDLGTCITYDWVDPKGCFMGGNISPGIEMRLQAMHEKTAALPKATLDFNVDLIGDSTESALRHGAVLGTICEIESFIDRSAVKYPNLVILLTGGNAEGISPHLKRKHEIHTDLLHVGLCELIRYNYDEFK